jgi:dolichyl-phosphate-mannose-protein mannosyltransferase
MSRGRAAGLVAGAAILRLLCALHPPVPEADAADYLRLARGLRSGQGFVDTSGGPTAFRPPLYPAFVAAVGGAPLAVALAQVVLGAVNCLLAVLLGRRLLGEGVAAWLAGLMLAVDPIHVLATARLQSEILYQTLLLAALVLTLGPPWRLRWVVVGACCGLAVLTRSAGLPVVPVLLGWVVWRDPGRVRAGLGLALGAALVLAPWIVRNGRTLGAWGLTTQGGITLYSSYHPPSGRVLGVLVHDATVAEAQAQGEAEADRRLRGAAWQAALSAPGRSLRLALLKVAFFWLPFDWEVAGPGGGLAPVFLFALPLAALAAVHDKHRFTLFLFLLATLTLFSALVYGSPRLRFPYDPLVYVMAAGTLARSSRRAIVTAWGAAVAAAWLAGPLLKHWVRSVAVMLGLW